MRDNLEELKCMMSMYNKKEYFKVAIMTVICLMAVIGFIAAVACLIKGKCCLCGCDDDDCFDFDDDFDDEDDDFEE